MSWRTLAAVCGLAFVITLAIVVGWRLSDEAMAVVVGVVAGVAASIPTSLLVVWVATRSLDAHARPRPPSVMRSAPAPPREAPHIIVVHTTPTGPMAPPPGRTATALPSYAAPPADTFGSLAPGPRHFTIIGENGPAEWDNA